MDRRNSQARARGERRADDAVRIQGALQARGRISLRVHGTSMLPWVRPGDIAVVRGGGLDGVRCGDVVLFRRSDHLFVHRIVEKRGALDKSRFFAKGDAHPTTDGAVTEDEMLGRVVRLYRRGRRIDLDAPVQMALGLVISQLSRRSAYWYPAAKAVAILTLPLRRLLQALRAPV